MQPVAVLVRRSCISFLIGIVVSTLALDRIESAHVLILAVATVGFSVCGLGILWRVQYLFLFGSALIGFWYLPFFSSQMRAPLPTSRVASGSIMLVEMQEKKQRLILRVEKPEAIRGRDLFVYVNRYPEHRVGERIEVECELRQPERFDDFAFDRYVARRRVVGICSYPRLTITGFDTSYRSVLAGVRGWYIQQYESFLPHNEAELLKAMVLNVTGAFPVYLREAFSASGLSHSISVSGLHMTLLIVMANIALGAFGCGRRMRLIVLSLGLIAYLVLLGFPAPAVRSSIMGILAIIGSNSGRSVNGVHLLIVTATAMVIENPLALGFDIGFQLSCLALLGMGLTNAWWKHLFRHIPERFGIREVIAATFSAQLYTWPLTLYYFGSFSLIAPIANLVVLPLFPFVLSLAFAVPLLISIPMVYPVGAFFLFIGTKLINVAVAFFAAIPFAAVSNIDFSWQTGVLAAAILIIATRRIRKKIVILYG